MTAHELGRALRGDDGDLRLAVRAQPGAKIAKVLGMWQDRVRIAIAAPPTDGKANAALERFIADACGLPQRDVVLVGGHAHRDKTVQLRATRAEVLAGLGQARDAS